MVDEERLVNWHRSSVSTSTERCSQQNTLLRTTLRNWETNMAEALESNENAERGVVSHWSIDCGPIEVPRDDVEMMFEDDEATLSGHD